MSKGIDFKHNPTILNDYLLYLQNIRNYSIRTIKGYESDLTMFFKFIIQYKNFNVDFNRLSLLALLQVTTSDIIAFLVYCNYTSNNSSSTRQRKLSAIKSFYKWLLINNPDIQQDDPAKEIPNIEPTIRLPKHLSLEQARKIQCIFTLKNCRTPIRNNTIIALFLSTGVRASELINMNVNDLDFSNNSIKIVGKGNKQRRVYFNAYCKKQLLKYLDMRENDLQIIDKDALFINARHKRIGINGIEEICEKAYKLMDLSNYGYTTHTLRHTAASLLYRYSKCDILLLKEFLGHSQVDTAEIYTHIYNERVKEVVEKNPLNNYKIKKIA